MTYLPESPDFSVRAATHNDIDNIFEIEKATFSDAWSRHSFESNIGTDYAFNVICQDEKIIGYAIISLMPPEGELYNIALASEYHGSGAARILYKKTENEAYEKGVKTVFLEVRESNVRAKVFYKKEGYTELGIRKNYYKSPTENAIIMSKDIQNNSNL